MLHLVKHAGSHGAELRGEIGNSHHPFVSLSVHPSVHKCCERINLEKKKVYRLEKIKYQLPFIEVGIIIIIIIIIGDYNNYNNYNYPQLYNNWYNNNNWSFPIYIHIQYIYMYFMWAAWWHNW